MLAKDDRQRSGIWCEGEVSMAGQAALTPRGDDASIVIRGTARRCESSLN
jgi:hypothetical protein